MNEILRRNHDIYMRIEKFEDYEFFNCIAYEMFQRSIGIEPLNIQKQYQENSKGYLIQGYDNLGNIIGFSQPQQLEMAIDSTLLNGNYSTFPLPWNSWFNTFFGANPQSVMPAQPGNGSSTGPLSINYNNWGNITIGVATALLTQDGSSDGDTASVNSDGSYNSIDEVNPTAAINGSAGSSWIVSPYDEFTYQQSTQGSSAPIDQDPYYQIAPELHSWSDFSATFKFSSSNSSNGNPDVCANNAATSDCYFYYTLTQGSPLVHFVLHNMAVIVRNTPLTPANPAYLNDQSPVQLQFGITPYDDDVIAQQSGGRIGTFLAYDGYQLLALFYDHNTVEAQCLSGANPAVSQPCEFTPPPVNLLFSINTTVDSATKEGYL
ncbi:MAG: hypothetical protein KBD64_08450, partial [Gammaproteobacteria bacterium]|nr:hypothetical protein [Gammaproteobacteria bacterium]